MLNSNELINAALKSTLLLSAAFLIVTILRRQPAAVRHLLWTAVFVALLALPFLSLSLPALPLPVGDTLLPSGVIFRATAFASDATPRITAAAGQAGISWSQVLTLLWAAGTAVSFGQMLIAAVAIRRLRRSARHSATTEFTELRRSLGIGREVELLEAGPDAMPMTCGLVHPAVFLPAGSAGWTEERRRVVLLHELAHVRRGDTAMHLLARTALALHWWNPLAWLAWREFLKERERAADDLVLNAGIRPAEYAGYLLDIARQSVVGCAAVAMARPSQLEGRLAAILETTRNRTAPRRAAGLVAVLLAVAVVTPIAALQAQLDAATPAALRDGIAAIANQEYEKAFSQLEEAAAADGALVSPATMWMGVVRERQDRAGEAEALYTRALAAADRTSPAAATIMELYARLLRAQDRMDEAASYQKEADVVRKQSGALPREAPHGVYRVGGAVMPPRVVAKVEPQYTEEARAAKYEGKVVVYAEIGVSGVAENVSVIQGLGLGLNENALVAISQWRFEPGTLNGQPVPVRATIEVNYRLL